MSVLKVDEWSDPNGSWHVADVRTWAGWHDFANVLGAPALNDFIQLLEDKYKARIHKLIKHNDEVILILFNWPPSAYSSAHKFKLDVNRLARKQGYNVEKPW